MLRRPRRPLTVAVLAVTCALAATSCASNKNATGPQSNAPVQKQAVALGTAAQSQGPDPAVPGAKPGGTVTVLETTDFSHLDPARVYAANNQTAELLLSRQLTTYQQVGTKTTLVGDLATDTGTSSDGGRTWTYTLKTGIKFQDGTPITSADVKYGIERTFETSLAGGPMYLQTWLTGSASYSSVYPGPWGGQQLAAIQTPDARTIVFHLKSPHADFPFAVAMQSYSPVPAAKDTKAAFDLDPFSSGPYEIQSHDPDKSMVLVRNPNWDPATDPARHAYPDQWDFQFGAQGEDIDQQLIAGNSADTDSMTFDVGVTSNDAEKVMTTPALEARTVNQLSPFSEFFAVNNKRVTNIKVRQALEDAFPRYQAREVFGGPFAGDLTTTIMSPVTNGYQNYDLYPVPDTGDPVAAQKLLAASGDPHPTIVFAYTDNPQWQQVSVVVAQQLDKAGFNVVTKPVSEKDYWDEIGQVDNQYDLYYAGWGPDWPSASTVIPPLFDGRVIADDGTNYPLFNDPAVNAQIDKIEAMPDLTQQDAAWAALDKTIMGQAAIIPWMDLRQVSLYGPGLGGVHLGFIGTCYPLDVYVK